MQREGAAVSIHAGQQNYIGPRVARGNFLRRLGFAFSPPVSPYSRISVQSGLFRSRSPASGIVEPCPSLLSAACCIAASTALQPPASSPLLRFWLPSPDRCSPPEKTTSDPHSADDFLPSRSFSRSMPVGTGLRLFCIGINLILQAHLVLENSHSCETCRFPLSSVVAEPCD